ncbi:MAG: class I SAM-dependent methyltransferase, partial [Anaerohalosphaera sp.]|nr:class I SAM-dependent methyltransferase [Anaerohalosphaera sp.]
YSNEHLDSYLVSGVEDPRINCQSILTRGLIGDSLWPGELGDLINAEMQFGAVMTWLMRKLDDGVSRETLMDAVTSGNDEIVPKFVIQAYSEGLREDCIVPDYITDSLVDISNDREETQLNELSLNTFIHLWEFATRGRTCKPVSIIEAACGSANDYRFINRYGLAEHLRYSGFDISSKNIANATNRFDDVDFFVGSIMDCGAANESYDYTFVHDLFEHLSIEAMEKALEEVVRIVRKEAWLHFFNAAKVDDHEVSRVSGYHWNTLSVDRVVRSLERLSASVEVINIAEMLEGKFGYQDYHNQQAVTMIVRKS